MAGIALFDEIILTALDRIRPRAVLALGIEHGFAPALRAFCIDSGARPILVERGAAVRWLSERGCPAPVVILDDDGDIAEAQRLVFVTRPALVLRHGVGGALAPQPGYTFRSIPVFSGLGALAADGSGADAAIAALFGAYDNALVRRLEQARRGGIA